MFRAAYPLLFMTLSLLAACSVPVTTTPPPAPPTPAPETKAPQPGPSQTGFASWYGPGFHGKVTASGATYDQHDHTAAHRTLPLGTRVRVTNLSNGKSTEVTITDRGPFLKDRIIDLSYTAAQEIGMIDKGTARVRLEVLDGKVDQIRSELDYTLQFGSFAQMDKAVRLKELLNQAFPPSDVSIVRFDKDGSTFYRVQAGIYNDRGAAESRARRMTEQGFSVIIMEK
ncbi:MAG TPA: septal ring lytic transglycosylase RlpA family protein [Candidatus Binatia bacterium]